MKIRLSHKAAVAILVLSLLAAAHGQVRGQTRNISVRMVSEPWTATENAGFPSPNASLLVPAPKTWTDFLASTNGAARPFTRAQAQETAPNSLVGAVFPGPADALPPDSQIAAGPGHLVSVVNSVVAIFSKSGNVITTTGLNSFFQSLVGNGCGCFDSRVLYDQNDNRFILSTSMRGSTSAILLAVSQTSDPTGVWNKFEVNPITDGWYDFPTLGLSPAAVYLCSDVVPDNGQNVAFEITVVGLAELLAGSSNLNITNFQNVASSGAIQGAITYGNSQTEFLLQSAGQGTVLHVYSINTSGPPRLSVADLTVPFYKQPPPLAPQPGGGHLINGPDDILSAVRRDNSLWTAHAVASDDGSTAMMRWYEIDTATIALKQTGTVAGAGDADYGVITVQPDGEVTLIYTTSSATQFASAGYAHRTASDPPGTMPVSGIYQAGTTTYSAPRWGDYSGVSPDPDGKSVWGIAELALTSNTTSTSIGQILSTIPPPSPDFAVAATPGSIAVTQGQSAVYAVTVSPQNGFHDLVTFSCGSLPANASCSFSPGAVTPGANSVSAQLTIATAPAQNAIYFPNSMSGLMLAALWIPLAGVLRLNRRRRIRWPLAVGLALLLCATWQIGCGGIGSQASNSTPTTPPPPPTPPPPSPPPPSGGGTPTGTYTVTVVGASGALQHSVNVSLTVK